MPNTIYKRLKEREIEFSRNDLRKIAFWVHEEYVKEYGKDPDKIEQEEEGGAVFSVFYYPDEWIEVIDRVADWFYRKKTKKAVAHENREKNQKNVKDSKSKDKKAPRGKGKQPIAKKGVRRPDKPKGDPKAPTTNKANKPYPKRKSAPSPGGRKPSGYSKPGIRRERPTPVAPSPDRIDPHLRDDYHTRTENFNYDDYRRREAVLDDSVGNSFGYNNRYNSNRNDNFNRNDGYNRRDNYNRNDSGYNRNDGFNRNDNRNRNDGYNKSDNYNRSEGGYNRNDGYNRSEGYNRGDNYNRSGDNNNRYNKDGNPNREGFKSRSRVDKPDYMKGEFKPSSSRTIGANQETNADGTPKRKRIAKPIFTYNPDEKKDE